jgi:hypothetical protein
MKRIGKGNKTATVETRRDFYEGVLYSAKQTARGEARRLADLLESKEATTGEICEAAWTAGQSASWLSTWANFLSDEKWPRVGIVRSDGEAS